MCPRVSVVAATELWYLSEALSLGKTPLVLLLTHSWTRFRRTRCGMLDMLSWSIENVSSTAFSISQQLTSLVVHPTINGLLAWTCQNTTGNRGDDFRSLKLPRFVFGHIFKYM